MWGGHEYLQRTTGLTYAEYVHQGFGQLTVATFLTLVVVGLTMRAPPVTTPATGCCCASLLGRPVPAHPRRRGERAVPDVALPGRVRLHGAAASSSTASSLAGAGRRVPARRRHPAVRLVGAAGRARLRRGLRPRLRGDEPGRLGRRSQHRPVRRRPALDTCTCPPCRPTRRRSSSSGLPAEVASCVTQAAGRRAVQGRGLARVEPGRQRAATATEQLAATGAAATDAACSVC